MERSQSHVEFFNCELQILHHYWRSESTIWTHFFCHQVLALTLFIQALLMLKSTGFLSFNALVHNQISYQKQLFIPVFEKTFHLPQETCFLFLSPSDLLTHTRKLNKSDLFKLYQLVNALYGWIWKPQINKLGEHIHKEGTTSHPPLTC